MEYKHSCKNNKISHFKSGGDEETGKKTPKRNKSRKGFQSLISTGKINDMRVVLK